MPTFGNTVAGSFGAGFDENVICAAGPFTSPSDFGILTDIYVYLSTNQKAGPIPTYAMIYSDNSSYPYNFLKASNPTSVVGLTPKWYDFNLPVSYQGSPNTPYWFIIEPYGAAPALLWKIYGNSSGGHFYYNPYSQNAPYEPSPFPTGLSDQGYYISVYGVYTSVTARKIRRLLVGEGL